MDKPNVKIYTDGGCKPNPGTGGWAALLIYGEHEKALSGGAKATTNNRMELTAACEALDALNQSCDVDFYTDSNYLKNGITQWLPNWIKKNWQTASRKPVLNQDLWERLHEATQRHTIHWNWLKGHAGHVYNERVDKLATLARQTIENTP